ncbi:MAG: hypothetical protein D6778_09955, partial [Nitrospirae bacterium]
TRTFTVKGALPEVKGLRGGLFAEVKVPVGETKKLFVPSKAIFKWPLRPYMWLTEKGEFI